MNNKEFKIAIAGLGNVGSGVYDILIKQRKTIENRAINNFKMVAVCARSKKDFIDESLVNFYNNPFDLIEKEDVNIIIELIGGNEVAYEFSKKALLSKKHLITANKAMIAHYGDELQKIADENGVSLFFEAAVAGAIPILKNLKEGLVANKIEKAYGILNGTCNYILTRMANEGSDFSPILKDAQSLGYAESDPSFDIEGVDCAHKTAIIAAIAENANPNFSASYIEGISKINIDDIQFAQEFGYEIKLLGIYESTPKGIKQWTYPALVASDQAIAQVKDSYNAILAYGNNAQWNMSIGRGAGMLPTASAVVADLFDIINDRKSFAFGAKNTSDNQINVLPIESRQGDYYIRFNIDKNFAQENEISTLLFQEDEIEFSTIAKDNEDKITYAFKIIDSNETKIQQYLNIIKETNEVSEINMIRIENIKSDI
jgi:homoserine dehydrogenase